MDPAINVIAALLNVLKSDNVEFTGLTAQGTVNVANILSQADAFVQQAIEAAEEPEGITIPIVEPEESEDE